MDTGDFNLLGRSRPTKEDLKNLEVFCVRDGCGDPVADRSGTVRYTKRRMNFMGFSGLLEHAIFRCPVCGSERKFTIGALTDKIEEV